jgi:hypothetical protein
VTLSTSRVRSSASGVAIIVVIAILGSACGGGDARTSAKPSVPPSTRAATPTPTPTPTPAPTAAATPVSRFEDRPEVQALRSWAAAATRDVNARHHRFPTARQFQVDSANTMSDVATSWRQEFDKYFPGPLPFTPIEVSRSGRRSVVTTCVTSAGFSLRKPGGQPAERHAVIPVVFTMARQGDSWLLADIVGGTADCKGVQIAPVPW